MQVVRASRLLLQRGERARSFIPAPRHRLRRTASTRAHAGPLRTFTHFVDGMTPMHAKDVIDDLRESHALVAAASNGFHRRGVIEWPQRQKPGENPMGAVMVRCPQT